MKGFLNFNQRRMERQLNKLQDEQDAIYEELDQIRNKFKVSLAQARVIRQERIDRAKEDRFVSEKDRYHIE